MDENLRLGGMNLNLALLFFIITRNHLDAIELGQKGDRETVRVQLELIKRTGERRSSRDDRFICES